MIEPLIFVPADGSDVYSTLRAEIAWLRSLLGEGIPDEPILFGSKPRHPDWDEARDLYVSKHPECEVCGTRNAIEVHHEVPFHEAPELELVPSNFISMCRPHHFFVGHLCRWSSWNRTVRADAAWWREKIRSRP